MPFKELNPKRGSFVPGVVFFQLTFLNSGFKRFVKPLMLQTMSVSRFPAGFLVKGLGDGSKRYVKGCKRKHVPKKQNWTPPAPGWTSPLLQKHRSCKGRHLLSISFPYLYSQFAYMVKKVFKLVCFGFFVVFSGKTTPQKK